MILVQFAGLQNPLSERLASVVTGVFSLNKVPDLLFGFFMAGWRWRMSKAFSLKAIAPLLR